VSVSLVLVKPNGILALPLSSAPALVAVYLALAARGWHVWVRRRRADAARTTSQPVAEPPRTALVESR
jgi:hypothetical protein